jgi:hypothetical protein
MANTMTLIASSTVGVLGASSIDFTSIPSTYTDLCLKVSGRTLATFGADEFYVQFNGSTSGLSYRLLIGTTNNGSAVSNTSSSGYVDGSTATSNTFGSADIYIPNYASANYKSLSIDSVTEDNSTTTRPALSAELWSSTSAITSIRLISTTPANFVQYSTAYLYGINNA